MHAARLLDSRSDLMAGLRQGVLLAAAALVLTLPPAGPVVLRTAAPAPGAAARAAAPNPGAAPHAGFRSADFAGRAASPGARFIADWVADSGNNGVLPFVILDKRDARIFVFAANAQLIDASPVLLGAAPGDDSVVGIGTRPIALVRPEEKTTPAGRFISAPGRNASGEDVVWVDYDAAVSMHRVRPVDPKERRLERLASPDPTQRRISYGCINVPVAFFESVVWPMLGSARAVIYVLPETKSPNEVFAGAYTSSAKMAQNPPPHAGL